MPARRLVPDRRPVELLPPTENDLEAQLLNHIYAGENAEAVGTFNKLVEQFPGYKSLGKNTAWTGSKFGDAEFAEFADAFDGSEGVVYGAFDSGLVAGSRPRTLVGEAKRSLIEMERIGDIDETDINDTERIIIADLIKSLKQGAQ